MWKVGLAENRLRAHFIEPRFWLGPEEPSDVERM